MFKVGDDVVSKVNVHGYTDLALKVHKVTFVDHGMVVINNEFYFKHEELRHATPEEIAVGRRIDKTPLMQHLDKCEEVVKTWPEWKQQSIRDAFGLPNLETLRDCDTPTNCKKIDLEQVK
ncbi:MAG: hypothetical protein [Caudoviricetes sp.]|nr:MAG: hypothetical protein [Caudoviricetes sp.]